MNPTNSKAVLATQWADEALHAARALRDFRDSLDGLFDPAHELATADAGFNAAAKLSVLNTLQRLLAPSTSPQALRRVVRSQLLVAEKDLLHAQFDLHRTVQSRLVRYWREYLAQLNDVESAEWARDEERN